MAHKVILSNSLLKTESSSARFLSRATLKGNPELGLTASSLPPNMAVTYKLNGSLFMRGGREGEGLLYLSLLNVQRSQRKEPLNL